MFFSDEVPQIDTTGTAEHVATVTSEPQSDMRHAEEDPSAVTQPAELAGSDSQTAEEGDGEASSCEITSPIPGSEETQTEREGAKAVLGTERDSAKAVLGTALQTERDRAKGMLGTALQDHSCGEPADPDIQSSDKTVTNTHELPKNVVVEKVESSSLPVEFDKTVSDGENVFINKTISMVIPHEDSEVGVKEDDRRPESESGLKTDSVVSQVAKDQEKKDIIDMTPDANATTILVNSEKSHSVKECSNMVSPMERTCTDDKVEGLASMAKASLNKTEKNSEAVDSKRAASVHIKVGDPFISADIGKKTEVGSFLPLSLKHGSANETFVKLEPKPRAEEATLRSFSTQSFLTPLKSSSRASSMSPDSAVSSPTSDWSPTATTTTTGGLLSNKSGSIKLTINQNRLGCLSSSPPDTLPSTSARTGHGVAKDMPDVDGNEVRALLMKKNSVKLTNSSDSRRASTDSSNAADESSDSVSRPMHRPHPLLDHDYTVFAYFNAQLNKTYADEVPVKSGHRHLDIKPKKRGRKKKSESGEGKDREKVKKRPYKRKHKANVSDTSRPATPGADSNDSTPPPLIPVDAEPEEKKEAKIVKEVPSRSPSKRKSDRNYVKITGSYQDEFVYFATRKIGRSRSRGSTDSHTPTTPVINPAFTDFSWYKELAKQKDKQEQFHGVQQGGLHISKSDSCLERRASVGTSASGVASEEDFSSVMGMTEEDNKMISSLLSWGQSPLKGASQKSIEPGAGLRKSLTMEGLHDQLGGQVQDLQALGLSLTQDQIKAVQNIIENDPGLMEQINQNFPGSESGEGAEKKAVEEKDENSQSEKKLSSTCPGGDNITIPGGQRSDLPFKEDMDGFETSVPVVPLKSAVIGGIGEKLPNPNMTPETSAADLFELDMNDLIPSSVANMSMILCDLNTDTKSSLASISTPINTSGAFENPLKITPTLNTLLCDQSESPLKSFMPSSTLPEMPTMASVVDFEGETNSLDKTELFPDIQQTFISSNNGTNDVTAPELTTVSMYWNDLPGLLINNKEYVRLVDIHKQVNTAFLAHLLMPI